MSTALFLKFLLPTAGVGGLVGVGVGVNHWLDAKSSTDTDKTNPKAILIAGTPTGAVAATGEDTITSYQCRLQGATSATPVDCSVKLLATTKSKNYETFDLLKTQPAEKLTIKKSDITQSNNIFQVLATQTFVESFTAADAKLEIVNKDSTPTVLATLDFLFGIKTSSSDELVGHTQYYLAQAKAFTDADTSTTPTSFTKSNKDYRCTITDAFAGTADKACEIFSFATSDSSSSSTNDVSALDYAHTTTQATTVSQHQWYVIKFTATQSLKPDTAVTDIYAHIVDNTSATSATTSGVTKIQFEKAIPMLIAEGTTKRALLLKAQAA